MAYLVLARKYRPQTFEEVVGQTHVTRTLANAIQSDRVAHAILFSGPRGTGKTTIARILAKAMNCESGPVPIPCNTCRSCQDITAGRGVDVFEIDGASNNSVDQVRELRDNIRYMPAHSRLKIYIIDEVHMLSIAAFNALLKTLEEPPAHVMFLFATTEAHKIPITILSRCQRHELKRIDLSSVSAHLDSLCKTEGVSISADNLWAISRESGGSLRDALSLLDQILACSGGQVDDDYVMGLLGAMDRKVLFDLSEATFARDVSRILSIIDDVFQNGKDLKRFFGEVLLHFRNLMMIKVKAGADLLSDLSPKEVESLERQVRDLPLSIIDQIYKVLFDAETIVRQAPQPRLAIEMAFFKIHQITPVLPIDLLIEKMDQLLKDPKLNATPGIVEAQSVYGDVPEKPVVRIEGPADVDPSDVGSPQLASVSIPDPVDTRQPMDGRGDLALWQRVIAAVSETKPAVGTALSRMQLIGETEDRICVRAGDNDYTTKLVQKNLPLIESACREHTGKAFRLEMSAGESNTKPDHVVSAKKRAETMERKLLNHPLVADAVDIFGGRIDEIKIK